MKTKIRTVKESSYKAANKLVLKLLDYGHDPNSFYDHREIDGLHHETIFIIAEAMENFCKGG